MKKITNKDNDMHMRKLLMFIVVFLAYTHLQAQEETTTLILVRHAEKAFDKGGDPALTDEGSQRAEHLAHVLKHMDIDAVYSTPFKRTRQTVEPVAITHDIEVTEYNPFKLEEMLDIILENKGKTLLISGHSNTTPALLNLLLKEDKYRQFDESDYDNLFIVYFLKPGYARVVELQYGEPSATE